jgi:hypothetical protein
MGRLCFRAVDQEFDERLAVKKTFPERVALVRGDDQRHQLAFARRLVPLLELG